MGLPAVSLQTRWLQGTPNACTTIHPSPPTFHRRSWGCRPALGSGTPRPRPHVLPSARSDGVDGLLHTWKASIYYHLMATRRAGKSGSLATTWRMLGTWSCSCTSSTYITYVLGHLSTRVTHNPINSSQSLHTSSILSRAQTTARNPSWSPLRIWNSEQFTKLTAGVDKGLIEIWHQHTACPRCRWSSWRTQLALLALSLLASCAAAPAAVWRTPRREAH